MKIEICEQLIASWLKHNKGCQIVQINWTCSPFTLDKISPNDIQTIENNVEKIKAEDSLNQLDIFKQSSIQQMLLQCEIDVVGIKIEEGIVENIYLVDSAFHEYGLNYGDVIARVLKKILRAVFISNLIYPSVPCSVIFVSPKCGQDLSNQLHSQLEVIKKLLSQDYPDSKMELLLNEDFTRTIYQPVLSICNKVSDDNDLFLRSLKLCKIAENYSNITQQQPIAKPSSSFVRFDGNEIPDGFTYINLTQKTYNTTKTPKGGNQQIVFNIFHNLIQHNKLDTALLNNLQSIPYCSKTFKLSYPVLIPCITFRQTGFEISRFYKNNPININGTDYYICSQWIPERIRRLQNWYEQLY